ncbi:sigma-70 family RNA polymerase sigma factor [Actinokineospora sp. 24-640]
MSTFDSIVHTHRAALLAYATRLCGGDRHRAEDVVQETWVRAWRNRDRLIEERGSVRGWLIRVTHNVAMDQHRHRAARPTEVEMPETDATFQPQADDQVLDRMLVDAALRTLPAQHRRTLVEVYFADRTAASAAEVLEVPTGTVKSRVHNALRNLRELPLLRTA